MDSEAELLKQSPQNSIDRNDPRTLPYFIFSYAFAHYYGSSNLNGMNRMLHACMTMRDWQRILRRMFAARTNKEEIPDVLIFDFDNYPQILSDLGLTDSSD